MDVEQVVSRPEFAVHVVHCRDDHESWSAPEDPGEPGIVLIRRGHYRRRVRGVDIDVDRSQGYLRRPGTPERFAHPAGGDSCTWISLAPALWRSLAAESWPDDADGILNDGETGGARRSPMSGGIYIDARLELAHRRLLAAARIGQEDDALEPVLTLFALAAGQALRSASRNSPARPEASCRDSVLVSAAKHAVIAGHPAAQKLTSLAAVLEVSPFRLSRAFTREAGISFTRFRNRIRVGQALARLEEGEQNLAVLAADLGFADQAHLCRTMRSHVGQSPRSVAGLLQG